MSKRSTRRSRRCAEFLEPGDAVLVKGARALGLEAVAETLAGAAA